MKRSIIRNLLKWKIDPQRKPLILRGARQVGKTYTVKEFAKSFDNFVEINFELFPKMKNIFDKDLSAKRITRDLSLALNITITPGKTLIFFDEIQAAPLAIIALRYFYEELPELHIIAAGSLLDFALDQIGVPVGRVNFLYMYPMTFLEFLDATGNHLLENEILNHHSTEPISEIVHQRILDLLAIYMAVGGMPEAVFTWIKTENLSLCSKVHHDLITAYKQDFQKYSTKFQLKYLDLLLTQIPKQLGKKFKYSNVSSDYRKRELEPCLDLLVKAGIVNKIYHSSGNGIPLGAEKNIDLFKTIFLDVALSQTILGLDASSWILDWQNSIINKGYIAESFVGQELLGYSNATIKQELYYWHREEKGSTSEVDYLCVYNSNVIPIEVKSNMGKSLKSMHQFLKDKPKTPFGVRISTHNYSEFDSIKSYPLYAVARLFKDLNL